MTGPGYTRDSVERALVVHGVDYSPPEQGGRRTWLLNTGIGRVEFTLPQVYAYVVGRADQKQKAGAR